MKSFSRLGLLLISVAGLALCGCAATRETAAPAKVKARTDIGIDVAQRALPTITNNVVQPTHYQHVYIDTSDSNAGSLQTIPLEDAINSNVLASSDLQVQRLTKIDSNSLQWAVLDRGFKRPNELEGVGGAGVQVNNFSEVNFPLNGTDILNSDRLKTLVSLASRVGGVFHIVGYADESGIEASNQKLSAERAMAVADALTSAGVNPSRVLTSGAGVSRLYQGLDANRRAAITFRIVE